MKTVPELPDYLVNIQPSPHSSDSEYRKKHQCNKPTEARSQPQA